jgi:transposase
VLTGKRSSVRSCNAANDDLPELARVGVELLLAQMRDFQARIGQVEQSILAWHRTNEASQRLETIPGIDLITATAIAATVTDPTAFRSGRELAAWIGSVPRQSGTGG